jgi:hypothetical protein
MIHYQMELDCNRFLLSKLSAGFAAKDEFPMTKIVPGAGFEPATSGYLIEPSYAEIMSPALSPG